MTVRRCPICRTAQQDDGRPGCACERKDPGERATAPDFSPLLIRPYVKVPEPADPKSPWPRSSTLGGRTPGSGGRAAPAAWARQEQADGARGHREVRDAASTGPGERRRTVLPVGGNEPAHDARGRTAGIVAGVSVAVLAASGALVGTWVLAQDSFDHAGPDRYTAAPTMVMPTGDDTPPSVLPSQSESASHGAPASPPGTPPSPSASPSASHPAASTSQGAGHSAPAADTASPPSVTWSASTVVDPPPSASPRVLKTGDTGPEVADLQRRLALVGGLYDGPVDGVYDDVVQDAVATFQQWRAVEGDEPGVYGSHTREVLERETGG